VIRTVEGSNDVGAMHEVITRRFRRLLEERSTTPQDADGPLLIDPDTGVPRRFAYLPSLIVVDGGAPQVAAAAAAMAELGITDVALCGLAKRLEEVWLPGQEFPLILPRASEALYLLQRVRDEAHRFAITHHRSRRSSAMVESVLDAVPGLGEIRRKAVLKHFGSLRKLRAAEVDAIAEVPGIGPRTAAAIKAALDGEEAAPAINLTTGEVIDAP
jgi:excinuclease ABC subunit C